MNYCETTQILSNDFDIWRSIPTNDKQFDEISWTQKGDPIYTIERELANSPNSGHAALTKVAAQLGNDLNDLTALKDEMDRGNEQRKRHRARERRLITALPGPRRGCDGGGPGCARRGCASFR